MPLHGTFIINDADYSPLLIHGIGTFMAFSGGGPYRNRRACAMLPKMGPVPPGKYWIVDRPMGGIRSRAITWAKDTYNEIFSNTLPRSQWFALYRDDGMIDDYTWVESVKRGAFRLHPGTISEGCITLAHVSNFISIRNALLRTNKVPVKRTGIQAYGTIEVIHSGAKDC